MPLPVIANAYRVTLNWQPDSSIIAHNVLHVVSTTANESDISASINTNLTTNMISMLGDLTQLDSIDIIKLDGSSAQQTFPATSSVNGTTTGGTVPAAAAVLTMHTAQRGPRGRGRLFLGPIGESGISNGFLVGGTSAAAIAAWTTFNGALAADDIALVVASYQHGDTHDVTGFAMRDQLGTVRRRQNQLL